MTSKQLVNNLCYEYGTKTYNEVRLKASQQLKKDLEDFEWLKSKINIVFLDSLSSPEDKERLLEIMGVKISYEK